MSALPAVLALLLGVVLGLCLGRRIYRRTLSLPDPGPASCLGLPDGRTIDAPPEVVEWVGSLHEVLDAVPGCPNGGVAERLLHVVDRLDVAEGRCEDSSSVSNAVLLRMPRSLAEESLSPDEFSRWLSIHPEQPEGGRQ